MEENSKKRKALPSFPSLANKKFFDETKMTKWRSVGGQLLTSKPHNTLPYSSTGVLPTIGYVKPRKLIIKNFEKPELPKNYLQRGWKHLEDAVSAINNSDPINTPLEELYYYVEYLCSNNMANFMYSNLKKMIQIYIDRKFVAIFVEDNKNLNYVPLLTSVNTYWQSFYQQMIMYKNIFLYLDRTYSLKTPGILSLWDLGFGIFRDNIMEPYHKFGIFIGLMHVIEIERNGEKVDKQLIKDLICMLSDLKLYQTPFESRFLKDTERYYESEGKTLIECMQVPAYLKHVNDRISEESTRIQYIHYSTQDSLLDCVKTKLVKENSKAILEKGFDQLADDKQIGDLALLYSMLEDSLPELCSHFNCYIKKRGSEIVGNPENHKTMVKELLDFKEDIDDIVSNCFENNIKFVNSQKEAFEGFFQKNTNKTAELIAKFADSKLRAGNKEATDDELEIILDKILVLFRYIQGKDIFEVYYKNFLAKRLLMGKSASLDAEKSMLSKLKTECGALYTSKLEGMFIDMEISKELLIAFKKHSCPSLSIDLSVSILTRSNWPNYPTATMMMPSFMFQTQELFRKYYMLKHTGRKLTWQPTLGHCVIKAHFPKGMKELQVSVTQCIVLLLFNNKTKWTFEEIQQNTGIAEEELQRTLQSLACGKTRVLRKAPKGKDINKSDRFAYNEAFTDKHFRIQINQIQIKEDGEEELLLNNQIYNDRKCQVDAAVVRIMKGRKVMTHSLLRAELRNHLSFPVKSILLKKRIERLLDQSYLKRDRDMNNMYHYVA